nr:MAG TPA: minor tail protein [Caudoviricetes sp.]
MRFDGGNMGSAKTQLKLLSNRAEDLGAQLSVTTRAYHELGDMRATGTTMTVRELASQTENAGLAAKQALDRYNAVDASLEKVYASINKAASSAENFGKGFDIRAEENVEETAEALRDLGVITDEEYQRLIQLRGAWQQAFDENEATKQVAEFERLDVTTQTLTAEVSGLARQMNEVKLPTSASQSFESTRAAVERIDNASKVLKDDLKAADEALRLDPSSVEAAQRKMGDLAQLSDLSARKAELLGTELSSLKDRGIDRVAESMENVNVSVEQAKANYAEVNSELSKAKGELSELLNAQRKLEQAGDTSSDNYRSLSVEITRASGEVEDLADRAKTAEQALSDASDAKRFQELTAQIRDAKQAADDYAGAMRKTDDATGVTWSNVKSLGMTLSATLTPAMTQLGQAALDSAADIDSAYRDMRKTVNGTEGDFQELKDAAIDFSTTHVTSADQILEIQAIGGELGIATSDLKEFSEVVSNIDVATDLNAEDAASVLGHLSNITTDTSSNMQGFADSLVRLGNNGASTETDIANIAERIGSMASIVGMSTPDILAWSSTIASTGQGAEAAGTAISNTISDIETAVSAGGDSLQGFADIAQMSAEDFAATWESDPTAALEAFIRGLNGIEEAGGSADAALEGVDIKASRQKQAIMGLMQVIDKTGDGVSSLNDNLQMSNDAWDGVSDQWGNAGDAANEANKKAEGLSGTLSQLDNIAQNAGSALGDAMLPALQQFRDLAQGAYDGFMKLSDGEKQMVVYAGGIAAALGPGLSIMSTLGINFDGLRKKVSAGRTVWSKLASGIGEATLAMADGSTQTQILAQAMQGLSTKQKLANAASGLMNKGLSLLKVGLAGLAVAGVVAVIGGLVTKFKEAKEHEELLAKATQTTAGILGDAQGAASGLGDAIGSIKPDADGVLQSMADLNESVKDTFTEYYKSEAKLDQYVKVIDELANKSGLTATEQWRLEEAVKGYNDVTGAQYEIVDKVNGVIADQSGVVQENTAQIDDNAEAWKRKAQAEAMSNLATKYIEQEAEATYNLQMAKEQLSDKQARLSELNEKGANKTREEVDETLRLNDEIPELEQNVSDLTATQQRAAKAQDYWAARAEVAASSISDSAKNVADAMVDTLSGMDGMGDKLSEVGSDLGELSIKLADAGVSTEDLNEIGSDNLKQLADACGGNIDSMVFFIQHYNDTPIQDKDGNINIDQAQLIDAQGNVYTWNGTALVDKDGNVALEDTELTDAQGNLWTWNGTALQSKDGAITINENGVEKAFDDRENWNTGSWLDKAATATVNIVRSITDFFGGNGNARGGIRPHADGGVRLHAGGAIATRAVPLDIVGEAGAEAIVPLTNRRYSQPFADIIGDAVIDRLSKLSGGGGTTINQSFQTKVVRADSDLYTAAPIIYRDAMNEARRVM